MFGVGDKRLHVILYHLNTGDFCSLLSFAVIYGAKGY